MDARRVAVIRRGIEAAVLASIPQVILPKLEEHVLLEEDESADLGPRFMEALAKRAQKPLPEDLKWLGASAFHFGYASFWGALYALLQERRPVSPWIGGLSLSGVIHLLTFPRWGAAVLTGTEDPPRDRPWRMEVVLATAAFCFGMGTALLYGDGPEHPPRSTRRLPWRGT